MTSPSHATRSTVQRCPACGQVIDAADAARCPLCDFNFGDERATGADLTPYAKAYARGMPGRRRMCEWVWFAGSGRLKHLALMRGSAASRRFAFWNLLIVAAGLSLFQATRVGWRFVTASPAIEVTGSVLPRGESWMRVAAAPRPLPLGQAPEIPVDLWWNPAQTAIAVAATFIGSLVLVWLTLRLTLVGVGLAHSSAYRAEGRMTAATDYGTAWCVPLVVAAGITGLRPLAFIGTIAHWAWCPSDQGLILSAAVLAGFGVAMWWFWLVRVGATAPTKTRARVVLFFALGSPLIVAAAAAAWTLGLPLAYAPLFEMFNVKF